mmetsp:Transcript_108785/g.294953  ORF Transcript_108785/g.294953 Transcript_108785/m.294953 type:complete len:93 (+) Transcript_108785:84-362(+)
MAGITSIAAYVSIAGLVCTVAAGALIYDKRFTALLLPPFLLWWGADYWANVQEARRQAAEADRAEADKGEAEPPAAAEAAAKAKRRNTPARG